MVLDAYHYIASLQRQVEDLNAELLEDASADAAQAIEEQSCEGQWSLSCLSGLRQQPIVSWAGSHLPWIVRKADLHIPPGYVKNTDSHDLISGTSR